MTNQPLITALRYAVSALGALVAMLVALGYLAKDDADKMLALLEKLAEHGGAIAGIIGALVTAGSAAWGAWKSSNAAHVARIEATPGVKLVVTNPNTAPSAIVDAAEDPTRLKVDIDPRAPEKIT